MPLYDYQCDHCQKVFEIQASLSEKKAGLHPECPQCHSKETHQILTIGQVLHATGEFITVTAPATTLHLETGYRK